jgi:NADPH2:quinone reductase
MPTGGRIEIARDPVLGRSVWYHRTMKAIRVHHFGGPEVLRLDEVPDPVAGAGQVLVRIRAAGVNPVDTYIRSGAYARRPALPYTPGSDGAGVVEAVGAGVTSVKPGEPVYVGNTVAGPFGTYAELTLCTPAQVHPLPHGVTFPQGAAVNVPYATAYQALFGRAHAQPGETVLVHGASGGVGIATVQLARAHGCVVIGTAGSEKGLELARHEGAQHTLNHHKPDYLSDLQAITHGRGIDVIVEMLANVNLAKDVMLLGAHGRVVIVGSRGTIEIDPRQVMSHEASVVGMLLYNATERELAAAHAAIGAGLANGTLKPVVGREIPLRDAGHAHETIASPSAYGKIVLVP